MLDNKTRNDIIKHNSVLAVERFPVYWSGRMEILKNSIDNILKEIDEFEDSYNNGININKEEANKLKMIWCISGSGSYEKKLVDTPSDNINKNISWYRGTDKIRLDYAALIVKEINRANRQTNLQHVQKIEERYPIIIYNGIKEQVEVLLQNAGKRYSIPKERIYIPNGQIVRTIDQIKYFSFPPKTELNNMLMGLVSHAPHISRILRIMSKNDSKFKPVEIKVFPIRLKSKMGNIEFIKREISGILDYIAKGEASIIPYEYKI